ncbi:MAG: MMPL family transporter [Proteobacteria bacterium]|nr:MMPL family transporter [Pseudomonadota bacterium]
MQEKQNASILGRVSLIIAAPALRWALPMLLLILALTGALVKPALEIQNDDDVIRFLPQDDPKVVKFMEIGERFHGLQMAIVGIEARNGDIFTLEHLTLLRRYAREFKMLVCTDIVNGGTTQCVSNTTSFTEIKDIAQSVTGRGEEESSVRDLVPELPLLGSPQAADPSLAETLAMVRERSLSLDHVRGFLVSPDGSSAAVYAQIDDMRVSAKEAADQIRDRLLAINAEMGVDVEIFFSGSPFIGSYSADQTRHDMMRLSPWVFAIILIIITAASRSFLACLIALVSVAVSIVWVLGGLSLAGIPMTLVSTSLPILLIALGSAYSIHFLTSTLSNIDQGVSRHEAVRRALTTTGPPIIVCALTTAAGFFSFMFMDVAPMVQFGLSMAISTLVVGLVTFWVVSVTCILFPLKPRKGGRAPAWALRGMQRGAGFVYRHGRLAALVVALVVVASVYGATRVEPHSDNSSLFAPGSPPVVADAFMNERFGGANFIQTEISGNITSPLVLRQIERMTAYVNAHPRIAGVQSISDIIVMVGGTMGDGRRIPPSPKLAAALAVLAYSEDASVAMMAENTWQHTLMQIRVRGMNLSEGAEIAEALQSVIVPLSATRIAVPRVHLNARAIQTEHDEMIQHLQWILRKYEREVSHEVLHKSLFETETAVNRDEIRIVLNINLFDEEDAMVFLDEARADLNEVTDAVMAAIQEGRYSESWLADLVRELALPEELENEEGFNLGVRYVHNQIEDASIKKLRRERVAEIFRTVDITDASEKLTELVESAIWSLSDDVVFLPKADFPELAAFVVDEQSMVVVPSGYPLIYSAMNASVVYNQKVSLGFSFVMVLICLIFFTRSILLALIAMIPASLTVLLTFGVMGLAGISMDVGSSMIAAISLSVGLDYACHLIWKFGRPRPDQAEASANRMLASTGWGIVINALEVGIGLSVLYFGTLLPMRNFGILTGFAMLMSAVVSLMLLPGLLRWASKWVKPAPGGMLELSPVGGALCCPGHDTAGPETQVLPEITASDEESDESHVDEKSEGSSEGDMLPASDVTQEADST